MSDAIRLSELADLVGGHFDGLKDPLISAAATLNTATAQDISFALSANHLRGLEETSAGAAVVPLAAGDCPLPVIKVSNVREAFSQVVRHFRPQREPRRVGISPAAHISPTAQLGEDVEIHPGAVIGEDVIIGAGCRIHAHVTIGDGCRLGDRVTLYPHVALYEDTRIGSRVIIHANSVIGAFGFGYDTVDGHHHLGAQFGHVEIGDDVELGACTTVDRGSYGPTRIGAGTKIDNHVMIAHNCQIGRHNLICSQVGVAGSSTTGDYVVMAGQVGVPDHIKIGDRAVLGAKAGIMRDVPAGVTMLGIPATPEREQMLKQAAFAKLPEMRKQLKALQRLVEAGQRAADAA